MSGVQIYNEAVRVIKEAILQSQYQAASIVNKEQLSLYYGIGKYVSENSRNDYWGKGAIDTISKQLQKDLPGFRGFSAANIKFMRQFYEMWCNDLKSLTAVSGIGDSKSLTGISEIDTRLLIPSGNTQKESFDAASFLGLGFTHHMIIVRKTKSLAERLFYIRQAYINKWSKEVLAARIEDDLFSHQGEIANNFTQKMPDARESLKAIGMFKDEYLLDFINVEELCERDKLKKGAFKSSYLGQLCTYLRLIDDQMRKPHENPSIGIVLCKSANKKYVEYVIQDYDKPLGVATYKTSDEMPEKLKQALPDTEELKKLL